MLPYVLLLLVIVALAVRMAFRRVTVFEFERGLRYRRGRFELVLGAGSYLIWPYTTTITRLDVRPTNQVVPGQEVITSDGVSLKVSVSAKYQVSDPARAINAVANYQIALYTQIQLALRELIAARPVDTVLSDRAGLNKQLLADCAPKAQEFGLTLSEVAVKDIMFPGELKKVFAQVVKARQEGLAALERARGETAALRNLANAAALIDQRPALLQLRLLQAIGQTSGNTVVLGMGQTQTIPFRQVGSEAAADPLTSGEDSDA